MGCTRIVALRGDLPSGMARAGDFRYAADLVAFIREHAGDHFRIEVACYPETHPQADDALSTCATSRPRSPPARTARSPSISSTPTPYFRFVDDMREAGINVPIVPGIMPISNFSQLRRFSEACGAEIPRWIAKRMQAYGDDADSIREFGADVVAAMCRRLVEGGAPGLHFYTLNRARPTEAVCRTCARLTRARLAAAMCPRRLPLRAACRHRLAVAYRARRGANSDHRCVAPTAAGIHRPALRRSCGADAA